MNQQLFNHSPEILTASVFGVRVTGPKAVRSDSAGELITSSSADIPIEASHLDIHALSGLTDSVLVYGQNTAFDAESAAIVGLGSYDFLPRNVGPYSRNTYLVVNTGSIALSVTLQLAPVNSSSYYVNDGSAFDLLVGDTHTFEPSRLMKFARIHVTALLLGSATVYYLGQT